MNTVSFNPYTGFINLFGSFRPAENLDNSDAKQASEPATKKAPHKTRSLLGGLVNQARDALKSFIKNNPVSLLISAIQNYRISDQIKEISSKTKQTSSLELENYHKSIEFTEGNKAKAIFAHHKSSQPGSKPLVVLIMGRGQTHADNEDKVGMLKIYNRLVKEDKADVLIFRAGSAIADLKHRYGLSSDASLKPELVKEHISNIIEARLKQQGKFSKDKKVTNVLFAGYSWGAGLQYELMKDWKRISAGVPVSISLGLDAIEYGCENLGSALKHRPSFSKRHINIFQNNDSLLAGTNLIDLKPGDKEYISDDITQAWCPDHKTLDDCNPIVDTAYKYICDEIDENLSEQDASKEIKVTEPLISLIKPESKKKLAFAA
jgi:hypothetical protein